jgi:hypothetical protein
MIYCCIEVIEMKKITISLDDAVYQFYQSVGKNAGGLSVEQVAADALFKLAGELSLNALHKKNIQG